MITRVIRATGIFSIITLAIILLFAYANFPEDILIMIDQSGGAGLYLTRTTVFFSSLAIMAFTNISLLVLIRLMKSSSSSSPIMIRWLWIFLNIVNFFFVISITFVSILNGQEKFDYSNFGYLIFTSLALMVIWVVGATAHWLISKKNK